eukprot:4343667-Amphidinium_carterae.2
MSLLACCGHGMHRYLAMLWTSATSYLPPQASFSDEKLMISFYNSKTSGWLVVGCISKFFGSLKPGASRASLFGVPEVHNTCAWGTEDRAFVCIVAALSVKLPCVVFLTASTCQLVHDP